jgi:DNA-binding response OmpR family regulator
VQPIAAPLALVPSGSRVEDRAVNILAVDDDTDLLEVICIYLEPTGHEVVTSTSAAHALALAAKTHFDLVLFDLGMRGGNGLDASDALRRAGYRGKIVLMTGWDIELLSSDARMRACDRILPKPFVADTFVRLIDELLRPT